MKKIRLSLIIALSAVCVNGFAQSSNLNGLLVNAYSFSPYDMLQLSQHNNAFTTARAAAMGGAFTSLGGDLSSMSINPAGIGMYRYAAFGFTPSLTFGNTENNFRIGRENKTSFALNNIGMVVNAYEKGRGSLVSFNFGISYNKLADFNYTTRGNIPQGPHSFADILALQMNGIYGYQGNGEWPVIDQDILQDKPFNNNDIYVDEWGGVLGYQTGLLNVVSPGGRDVYAPLGIDDIAIISSDFVINSRGSVGEYNFAGGMNLSNILYLGFGLTVQSIYLSQDIFYSERYENNLGKDPGINYLQSMSYEQYVRLSGTGVNFKFGAIYRPLPGIRLGLAVHTPTFTSVTQQYSAQMSTRFQTGTPVERTRYTPANYWDYNYNSPTRLLAGISFTISDFAALSVDYERAWYNKMKLTSESNMQNSLYNNMISENFMATDNVRIGLEVKPVPVMAIRLGYAHYASALRDDQNIYNKLINTNTNNHITAGLGFRLGYRTTLDIAYIYTKGRYKSFDLFYYEGDYLRPDGTTASTTDGNPISTTDPVWRFDVHRHTVSMSFNFLF